MRSQPIENAQDEPTPAKVRKVVNLPLRLTPAQHDALRTLAFVRLVSIHSLMLEGVAEVLRRGGK